MVAMAHYFGTFWTAAGWDNEDHDLFLDEAGLGFVVVVHTEMATVSMPLDDYLTRHPERRPAVLDAVRTRLA